MKHTIQFALVLLLLFVVGLSAQGKLRKQVSSCSATDSTSFFLTNRTTAFYFGEACRSNTAAMQGFNVQTEEYLDDYILLFDGNRLNRSGADVFIYSDRVVRKYSPQQITEEISLTDTLNILHVRITSEVHGVIDMIPVFSAARQPRDFEVRWEREFGMLHVGQPALTDKPSPAKLPARTMLTSRPAANFVAFDTKRRETFGPEFAQAAFLPGSLQVALRDSLSFHVMAGGDSHALTPRLQSGK